MILRGIKVIELSGLAPVPFCGKVLADYGADVIRVDRPKAMPTEWLDAKKRSIMLDLKKPSAVEVVKKLCLKSDVLIDPYRPGVLEKMGLGPTEVMAANPRLVFARISGYGQSGPLAKAVGHDINYVALSGILSMLGRKENVPTPPANLLADFAGGGLLGALGIVLALLDRTNTGVGQVVDLSMSEGAAYVGSWFYSAKNSYVWGQPRGENWLDSGSHFYDTYETKDGHHMVVGAVEPHFYAALLQGLELHGEEAPEQLSDFKDGKAKIAERFKQKTRKEWEQVFASIDACVTPVLSLDEAPCDPHNVARNNFRRVGRSGNTGWHWEPTPAPKFTDINGRMQNGDDDDNKPLSSPTLGEHSVQVLEELGYSKEEIAALVEQGSVRVMLTSKL